MNKCYLKICDLDPVGVLEMHILVIAVWLLQPDHTFNKKNCVWTYLLGDLKSLDITFIVFQCKDA